MSLLLLKNKIQCPKCRRPHRCLLPSQCRVCGMWLFLATHDFDKFQEDTSWREYWVFTTNYGWVHQTQLKMELKPLEQDYYKPTKLPENYGTQEFINEKIANSRIELKEALKHKKKIGIPHK